MTDQADTKSIDRGSLVLGTIMAVPVFFVCFLVVAVVAYVVHTFLAGSVSNGVPRLVELSAAIISSMLGVGAGRWVCDKAFKAWSGWPIFVLFVLFSLISLLAMFLGYGEGVWQSILAIAQLGSACIATWLWAVKKLDFN